jgi:outer membrane protein
VRQSKYLWNAGKAGYEATLRQAEQQARDAYQGVISQIAQVEALKQAVESNRVSLQATEAGYEVGTKTAIDVLSSRELLVQAQTNYSQSKYAYLNNIIALRLAAGNLDPQTIKQINGWLVPPVAPLPETMPTPNLMQPTTTAPPPSTPTPAPAGAPSASAPESAPAPAPAPPGTP